jgi:thiol:disulfide interchange protein
MPFGSVFGAIVFGVLGVMFGTRMLGAPAAPEKLMGVCLVVLGVTVAGGLLMKRAWARWVGVVTGFWFAWSAGRAFIEQGGVLQLTVVLAASAVAIFLIVPATGRPVKDAKAGPSAPSFASRLLFGGACLAITGFVGAAGWAVARQPVQPEALLAESTQGEARPVDASPAGEHLPAARPAAPKGAVAWHDFGEGLKQAKSDRKLIVADFYATWCGPCKMMEKQTFHDPRVVTRLRDVVPVRVDAEETADRGGYKGADLALRYSIEVYPTIVVVDGNGHEVARNTGMMDPDEFLAWIDDVIERAGTTVARS